jgi:hypothetical protein
MGLQGGRRGRAPEINPPQIQGTISGGWSPIRPSAVPRKRPSRRAPSSRSSGTVTTAQACGVLSHRMGVPGGRRGRAPHQSHPHRSPPLGRTIRQMEPGWSPARSPEGVISRGKDVEAPSDAPLWAPKPRALPGPAGREGVPAKGVRDRHRDPVAAPQEAARDRRPT